ncbi:MAG: acyl carrier protein [Anaerolineales bacterium]|jgi:acyl carrier protein
MDDIEDRLRAYLADNCLHLPPAQIPTEQPLLTSGLVDSFHLVDLALFVESEFGVRIDDTELNPGTFDTLNQLAQLIRMRRP